jgi:hypothetical protein
MRARYDENTATAAMIMQNISKFLIGECLVLACLIAILIATGAKFGAIMFHNRFVQFAILCAAGAVADLISLGLDKVWRKSRWRNAVMTGCCFWVALWFLP